ncbi:MAG: AAA family ATPase [Acidimicrobiia bacterium]|nr:AAA family ATPase [Acidimicrobiia bacterium]
MFLQALTLKGFKSFAETTTISFAPGLSVIVGPNGSGKSNIVDAISWVLGSQSPTALRSQQMDDVIFAGNPGRPALGRAEVTLTFDNADRRLPLDLDEVAISRTLFRSGDSAYAINATQTRLIDIAEMLSGAGVGRHRHVIVSQGHIDAVLRAKPAERRAVLEEAAGVSAYRVRKEKALRRLTDTEANLARLGDQLNEVRRALRPLEKQASVARRHGALAAELAALQNHRLGAEQGELRAPRPAAGPRRPPRRGRPRARRPRRALRLRRGAPVGSGPRGAGHRQRASRHPGGPRAAGPAGDQPAPAGLRAPPPGMVGRRSAGLPRRRVRPHRGRPRRIGRRRGGGVRRTRSPRRRRGRTGGRRAAAGAGGRHRDGRPAGPGRRCRRVRPVAGAGRRPGPDVG